MVAVLVGTGAVARAEVDRQQAQVGAGQVTHGERVGAAAGIEGDLLDVVQQHGDRWRGAHRDLQADLLRTGIQHPAEHDRIACRAAVEGDAVSTGQAGVFNIGVDALVGHPGVGVVAGAADQLVQAQPAHQAVVVVAAPQAVVAGVADQGVVAGAAVEGVVVGATGQGVAVGVAAQVGHAAAAIGQHVVAGTP